MTINSCPNNKKRKFQNLLTLTASTACCRMLVNLENIFFFINLLFRNLFSGNLQLISHFLGFVFSGNTFLLLLSYKVVVVVFSQLSPAPYRTLTVRFFNIRESDRLWYLFVFNEFDYFKVFFFCRERRRTFGNLSRLEFV